MIFCAIYVLRVEAQIIPMAYWNASGGNCTASSSRKLFFTSNQAWPVPSGISCVLVKAWGGAGGGTFNSYAIPNFAVSGGPGGYATGVVTVSAGSTLQIAVGGGGGKSGAGGGGVNGGGTAAAAGSGGGFSGVFQNSISQANALVLAGGGGGGCVANVAGHPGGGGGGVDGGDANDGCHGGYGASQTAPGYGGRGVVQFNITPLGSGDVLQGGSGIGSDGGGGGGYFGGAGGSSVGTCSQSSYASCAGGGGGSAWATGTNASTTQAVKGTVNPVATGTPANPSDPDLPASCAHSSMNGSGQAGCVILYY